MTLYEVHVGRCDYAIPITRYTNNFQLSFFIHKEDFQIMHNKAPENLPHTPQRYSSPLWQWMSKVKTHFSHKNRITIHLPIFKCYCHCTSTYPTNMMWPALAPSVARLSALQRRTPAGKQNARLTQKLGDRDPYLSNNSHHAPSAVLIRQHSSQTCFDAYHDWLTNIRDLNIKI